MKSMRRVSRGKGFRGVLQYNAKNRLIGGNVTGSNWVNLAKEFSLVKRLRPDIEKPVWHQALRLPKGEALSDALWMAVADRYMDLMGFSDAHPRAVFLEDDPNGQHVHIVASRVALDGTVYLGQNENLISTKVCEQLEQDFQLQVTKGTGAGTNGKTSIPDRRTVSSNELNCAIRTRVEPPRMTLQRLVEMAWKGNPSIQQFVERLSSEQVAIVPNIASTGLMNGFKFSLDEKVWFTGSQLGAAYKWQGLKGKIRYDENRDTGFLIRLKNARAVSELGGSGTPTEKPSAADGSCDASFVTDKGDAILAGSPSSRSKSDQPGIESVGASAGEDLVGSGSNSSTVGISEYIPDQCCNGDPNSGGHAGMEREQAAQSESSCSNPTSTAAIPTWAKQQLDAFERMHRALNAPQYRITPTDRGGGGNRTNVLLPDGRYLTDKIRERGEYFWKPEDLRRWIRSGDAGKLNSRRFDIYVTPIDDQHHYILIDDIKGIEAVKALRKLGYRPALVQKSSEGNYQAVIKTRRNAAFEKEQSAANRIVVRLNKASGDPKVSGVRRPFRMSGFRNKKPGRGDVITQIDWGLSSPGAICDVASNDLEMERQNMLREEQDVRPAKRQAKPTGFSLNAEATETPDSRRYLGMMRGYQTIFGCQGTVDLSSADFRCVRTLLSEGWKPERIAVAMQAGSPNIAQRHADCEVYILRTISNALERLDSDARKRHRLQKSAQIRGPTFSR